jgi:hypothetical protein
MTGKKETLIEKIIKPVRINPVTFGVAVAGFGMSLLLYDQNDNIKQAWSGAMTIIGFAGFMQYMKYGVQAYFRSMESLTRHGFDERYAVLRMTEYCDRQAFYTACISTGNRNEARAFIENTPRECKKFAFIPHV